MEQKITSKTATFFICTVAYEKIMENGTQKKVKELYVVPAESFTEAESKVIKEMTIYVPGGVDVVDITKASFKEFFFTNNTAADRYYKVKTNFILLDENTGKEKKSLVYFLVQATSTKDAQRNFDDIMGKTMINYSIEAIIETKILDVFFS